MVEYETMLSEENIRAILASRNGDERNIRSLRIGEKELKVNGFLNSGGTKEVYDVEFDGLRYALGVCGTLDNPEVIRTKWLDVLREHGNTTRLRSEGLLVNELSEILPVEINGFRFPAILMRRYADHPFAILDSKNGRNENPTLSESLDEKSMPAYFKKVMSDVEKLIGIGANVGRDSFNIAVVDGGNRLYFNDIGKASFGVPFGDVRKVKKVYAEMALGAFVQSLSHRQYKRSKFLNEMDSSVVAELLLAG